MADNDELVVQIRFKTLDQINGTLNGVINKAISGSKNLEQRISKTTSSINRALTTATNKFDKFGRRGSIAYKKLQREIRKFNDLQERTNKNSNDTLSALKKVAAITLSASAIKQGITLAADYAETLGKLGDVFNNQVVLDKLNNQVDKFTERLGISQSTLNEYYANSGALFKGIGFDLNKSFDASTKAIQTAMDLASFHNIERERALDAVKAAILGEAESLKSATGITVMDTTMTEYAKKMKKAWSKMDLQEKATLRLQYIIESTENQGAKDNLFKTKNSFANLSASIPDLLKHNTIMMYSQIINELTPALSALRNALVSNQEVFVATGSAVARVINIGAKFIGWLSGSSESAKITRMALTGLAMAYVTYKTVVGTATAITKIQNLVVGKESALALFKSSAAIIKNTAIMIANKAVHMASIPIILAKNAAITSMGVIQTAVGAVTKTFTAVQWALNAALSANPIGVVVMGIAALGGALVVAYKKSETFRNMISNVFNKLKEMKDWIVESKLGKIVGGIFSWWKGEDSEKPQKKTDIPKHARGTSFAPGGITLVGEEGPELIKLPRGTQVFNNEKTNSILNNYYNNDNSKITNIDNNYKTNTTNNSFSNLVKNIYNRTFENIRNFTELRNVQNDFSDVRNNLNTENDYSKIINTLNNSYNNQKSIMNEYSKINNVSNLIKKENTLNDNRKNIENKSTNLLKTMYDYANYVTKNAVNNAYNNLYDSKKFDTDYDYSSYDNRVYETKENNNYVSNSAEDKKYYISNKNNTMNTNSSSKGDINYISIQGDSIQITFENINTFEDMKEKIEEFMFKSAIKKQQRLEAILGGKK